MFPHAVVVSTTKIVAKVSATDGGLVDRGNGLMVLWGFPSEALHSGMQADTIWRHHGHGFSISQCEFILILGVIL